MLKQYLIKAGTVLSVRSGEQRRADIRVVNGVVRQICSDMAPMEHEEVINAAGMLITTGWVDSHCHVGVDPDGIGIKPMEYLLSQGTTYAVDAGTAGADTFELFRKLVRYRSDLQYRAYLNLGSTGMHDSRKDTERPEDIDTDAIAAVCAKYPKEILGLKIRIDPNFCFDPKYVLKQARMLADNLGLSVAVHAPRCPLPLETVLSYLVKGDVFAHTLAGIVPGMTIIDESGHLKTCVKEAQDRGVIFDLSHGTNQFSYKVAESAWKDGFVPAIISSDLHHSNIRGPVFNLAAVMTKIKGITNLDWLEIIRKVTVRPVELLGLEDKQLDIQIGAPADLTIFTVENGSFTYLDSTEQARTCTERLNVQYTCLNDYVYCSRESLREV